ncbi:ATP-dependent bile acid permease [Choanephora cucurbitarum]|uniref:ATP-dependent bile acid permease n=1 Tax=Choanephora cucurbitarum TaxID=101091 RepID=A0A1C7NJQ0_9FUNG|nr:ATP-dependent bile acid permease [Choanephora cucurbitarum]
MENPITQNTVLRLLVIGSTAQYWDISYFLVTFLLFAIAGSTPQPYHPKDLQVETYEKLEIKDDKVYIDGRLLSPESTASVFSWAAFQWMNPLVVFGFRNTVDRSNIYAMTFQHLARNAYADYISAATFLSRTKVLRRIYKSNKREIWTQLIFSLLACLIAYLAPYFQQKLLEYFEQGNNRGPVQTAYLYTLGMFMVGVVKLMCNSIQLWAGRRWNIRTFSMLDAEIFNKTLKRKDMLGKVSNSKQNEEKEDEEGNEKEDDDQSFSNIGKITNLMSIDADHLANIPSYIHMIYASPVEVTVALIYLYNLLGQAALVGLAVMLLTFPLSAYLTKKMTKNYLSYNAAKDNRNELVNEMLQGIRMIKYFAWEANWIEKVTDSRNKEIKKMILVIIGDVLIHVVFLLVPVLVTASTFVWYTKVAGNELTASIAFVSITLFEMLRNPLILVPETINTFTEGYTNLKRICNYLEEPEVGDNINFDPIEIPDNVSPHVVLSRTGFENSVFEWHAEKGKEVPFTDVPSDEEQGSSQSLTGSTVSNETAHRKFQLSVPQFNFPTSKLSIVCGPTGSGKSSFLHALLGEMDIISGRVYLPSKVVLNKKDVSNIDPEYPDLYLNKVAYVAQQPFLQHASIRSNILFGLPFDAERYKKVLFQCALIKDLQILPDGDRTEIGEKGISLSGGQKQRVSLARAVYSRAKTVLLDDCLSAVDAHTSKHIYRHCLTGDLLKGRTVILVTHQVRLCLPGANFFVKIENGNVVAYDTVERLRSTGTLAKHLGSEDQEDENQNQEDDIEEIVDGDDSMNIDLDLEDTKEAKKLIQEENSEKGQVKFKVYSTYLSACGGWFYWTLVIFAYVFCRLLVFGENWWLRIWSASYSSSHDNSLGAMMEQTPQYSIMFSNSPAAQSVINSLGTAAQKQTIFKSWVFEEKSPVNVDYYIGIYLALCFGYVAVDVLRNILISWGTVRGARKLFSAMLYRITHAPMRFFDTTPVGRILNRFGKDISTIDMQIARNASFLVECVTSIIASTAIISSITPQFLIVAIAVSGIYFLIGIFYLRISRELKRLNSVSRSPIYSHFTESLSGVVTIRAYGVQEEFMRTVYEKLDNYIAPFYLLWMSNRWLYARIEFSGAFVTFFTGVFLLINIDKIDAGMAGISLFYAGTFLENIYWFIRQYTSVEMDLNSVERVQEYLEIDQEPPARIEGHRPPAAWPTNAAIEVKNLVVRYAPELDPVLHDVSFSSKPHEKIGIVGRTGSGKSTMALSFFRLLEADSGSISIDGIDISKIGLEDLRSQITIIPQDAVLFSGTIRSNIDPFDEHTDEEVWESLERAHISKSSDRLKQIRSGTSTPSGASRTLTIDGEEQYSAITSLSQKVSDGGNNFSQGQRQLLCLARALLKNSKLIVMDEATASVDFDTDAKIQRTIREEFTNSTLLCIAHRLRTVIDYDRILVLDQGKVVEYDTPYNLITGSTGTSAFKSMCERSGEFDSLLKMATEAHQASKITE